MNACVGGLLVKPGPIATAENVWIFAFSVFHACAENVCCGVSASGHVIRTGAIFRCRVRLRLLGTPRVMSPAPALIAESPQRAAAPNIRGDPARMRAWPKVFL